MWSRRCYHGGHHWYTSGLRILDLTAFLRKHGTRTLQRRIRSSRITSQRSCVSTERERHSDVSGRREFDLQRSCGSPERGRHSDVSGRREFDLVLAQEVLNHDAKLVEEFLGEQLVDDNDVVLDGA